MITDADVTKLKKVFVTKNDAKKFATKDDLKGFATKDDLKKLDKKVDFLSGHVVEHSQRLDSIETKLEKLDPIPKQLNTIISMLDAQVKRQTDNESETAAVHHKLERHDGWIHQLASETNVKLAT